MHAIRQPIYIRNPLLKIGSFAVAKVHKLDLSKLANEALERRNAIIPLPYNTILRDHSVFTK